MLMNFFPPIIIPFLAVFRQGFTSPQYQYFLGFLWGLVAIQGKKTLTRLASGNPWLRQHVSGWSRFLGCSQWDLAGVQRGLWCMLLIVLGGRLFYKGYLVAALDTSLIPVFSKRLLGVQRWHDHSGNTQRGGYVQGQHWGLIGLLIKGKPWICLPLVSRLLYGQKNLGFVSQADGTIVIADIWFQVLALCRQLQYLVQWPLIIVADAFFSKAKFINGLRKQHIILVSRLRHDAVGRYALAPETGKRRGRPRKYGQEIKLKDLLKTKSRQEAVVERYGKTGPVCFAEEILLLRDVPKPVKVVVVKTKAKPLILVCTALHLTAVDIIELYAARFPIETAIQFMKGEMGMLDCQCTTSVAAHRFMNLVCIATAWWRAIAMTIPVKTWSKNFTPKPYVVHTNTSFALIRQVLRHWAVRQLIFPKLAKINNLRKITTMCNDIDKLAA